MKAVTFLLHTQQPILATSLQGDPNSDVSYPYIPGSMIRGFLIGRYLQKLGIKATDDIDKFPDVKLLFFDATTTCYLNAYPFINNKRTLPIPRSWYKDKGVTFSEDHAKTIYDFSKIPLDEQNELLNENEENLSPKLLEENFCLVDDEVLLYKVKRRINIHNKRDRKRGKGIEGSGAIFSYDAIDAGQSFQGVILCKTQEDQAIIESLLQQKDVWLGGSQSAGYGYLQIELLNNDSEWYEILDLKERIENQKYLTVTLLSDTIIYDKFGQIVSNPETLRQILSDTLNQELKFQEGGIYTSSIIVGGFNRKWGLPLPQTPALAAGSVFVFENIDISSEKFQEFLDNVKRIEDQGIGERRVDGFGRVVFNWLDEETEEYKAKLCNQEFQTTQPAQNKEPLKSESSKIAAGIANRIVRKKLDVLIIQQVSNISLNNPEEISNSQLSRLMLVTRQVLYEVESGQTKYENERKSITELVEPINNLIHNLPSNARKQFERSKLNEHINQWLNVENSWLEKVWRSNPETKHLIVNGQPKVIIARENKDIDTYITLEYSLRLIIAVVKKIMKDKK
jgi:CRISPR-associated protein Csx10